MTPQEKYAEDLIKQYQDVPIDHLYLGPVYMGYKAAVKCAFIDVDNTIKSLNSCELVNRIHHKDGNIYDSKIGQEIKYDDSNDYIGIFNNVEFYKEVKQILENKLK